MYMRIRRLPRLWSLASVLCLLQCVTCPWSSAQAPTFAAPAPSITESSLITVTTPEVSSLHKFWDPTNLVLFSANAALSSADFVVTRDNLENGGRELNPAARLFGRSTPGLALNFAGQTACVITTSYLFHRTGHHKLERWVSALNMGASGGAVAFDLTHR